MPHLVRRPLRLVATRLAFALAAAAAASAASAQGFTVGIGAGTDRGHVDCVPSFPCDRSSTDWKLTGAWRFAEVYDVQLAYFGAGRFQGGDVTPAGTEFGGTFKISGIGLTAGYRWDFAPSWSLVARAGAANVHTRFEYANALAGDVTKTTLQPLAGIGVGYAITPSVRVGLDYDITRFKAYTRNGSLRMLGLAAQFSF